eukprot:CAMPEP_0119106486 /NCGR_PEP_ID=MMETSP1180-20130426/4483_1 /TAXON_ID=3052 ORGANISM="Chlamydomonas cf sp, Strain CCMP681" /NCGR_SAMPLE_ID=MMETSP1180 /ASSEMBLY_ACC=CAM_ASM_000741 /LENGTH=117 /DNA_ID=CAMNT_0007091835 /DNA_START=150 /DNA_END=503 /DNA_ORIENTATION=+
MDAAQFGAILDRLGALEVGLDASRAQVQAQGALIAQQQDEIVWLKDEASVLRTHAAMASLCVEQLQTSNHQLQGHIYRQDLRIMELHRKAVTRDREVVRGQVEILRKRLAGTPFTGY